MPVPPPAIHVTNTKITSVKNTEPPGGTDGGSEDSTVFSLWLTFAPDFQHHDGLMIDKANASVEYWCGVTDAQGNAAHVFGRTLTATERSDLIDRINLRHPADPPRELSSNYSPATPLSGDRMWTFAIHADFPVAGTDEVIRVRHALRTSAASLASLEGLH